ncbi:MAG TPA: ImmA/IrrE family metallo-endopeptidase [Pyrinomonadaceae bacterium]|nr:ImmA/IrrE family metallo-endopeptidase [Pyrinomonadaceae bacterium]
MTIERIHSINPDRIVWCCSDRGITPWELADELGISESTMQKVLRREDGMTFPQLQRMGEYFGRGVLFFLEDGPVDARKVYTAQFRTLANQKPELSPKVKAIIERVEKQRDVYLNLRESLRNQEFHSFDPPENMTQLSTLEAAAHARRWLGLGEQNTFDSYRTAVEARGILVFRSNGYSGKWQIPKDDPILGFTLFDPVCPVIFVKKQWESQQSFTLLHELGHVLLHKTSSIDDESDFQSHAGKEREANAFAGQVLVPDRFLGLIDDRDRPDSVPEYDNWLKSQRKTWGVSTEVILRRLLDSGRLTGSQYNGYRRWRSKIKAEPSTGTREYRHREPKHVFGDTFVLTVLEALNARYVTLAKASTYLDSLKIQDLHKLERYYASL